MRSVRRLRRTHRNDARVTAGSGMAAFFPLADQDWLWRIQKAVPSLRDELDGILERLQRAGAVPPYRFQGVGMTGFVVCDAYGRGFKAARSMTPTLLAMLADETEWLRVAGQDPAIRTHVARVTRWHAREGVIERECVRAKADARPSWKDEKRLFELHQLLARVMLGYGWTQPEFKPDSYVFTPDRGPVLVDAGFVHRTGSRLARAVIQKHRDSSVSKDDREFARGLLRLEYDQTIPRAVGTRLHDRLATLPNGAPVPRRPAEVPATARPWTADAQRRGDVRVGDWIVVARAHPGYGRPAVSRYVAQPVRLSGGRRDATQVIALNGDGESDLYLGYGDVAWTWTPATPAVTFTAEGPWVYAHVQHQRVPVALFDTEIEGDGRTEPTLYFDDPVGAAREFAARLNGEATGALPVTAPTYAPRPPRASAQRALFNPAPARRPRAPRTYPNDAFARRTGHDGDVDLVRPPALSDDHWQSPAVETATRHARYTTQHSYTTPGGGYGRPEKLGQGHFGIAYRVDTEVGPRVVKIPAAFDSHGLAWTREKQTEWSRHEAGVANELAAQGVSVVPRAVYTEFGGGTPALVREYGEPVTALTGPEYAALEAELVRVERELGWSVQDDLQLYRRPDGSIYVGDVGFWVAPPLGKKKRVWQPGDTSLDLKLQDVQKRLLPGLPWRDDPAKRTPGYEYTARASVPTLPRLLALASYIEKDTPQGPTKSEAWLREIQREEATKLLNALAARAALGVPPPHDPAILQVLPLARALVAQNPALEPGDVSS